MAAEYKGKGGKTACSESGDVGATACQAPGPATAPKAEGVNHGANLTWGRSSGYDVTYDVAWPGGSATTKLPSYDVRGLPNARTHRPTVTARNGAGASAAVAAAVDLAYPTERIKNRNDGQTNTIIRPGPSRDGATDKKIPQGEIITMTVVCQVRGESYRDPESGTSSDVWNRVETRYGDGYLDDTLVATSGNGFPSDGLYECEM